MKKGYKGSVGEVVAGNSNFRKVLYTGAHLQLVAMTLQPNEDIGEEDHEGHDQFFHFVSGEGEVLVGETTYQVTAGDVVIVPSGVLHNVTNTSDSAVLELYTTYSPPEHADGVIHSTKIEAESDDEHFDGGTTE